MSKHKPLDKVKFLIRETILILVIVAVFLLLYSGGLGEILSVIIGLLVAHIITNITLIFKYRHEDESKLSEDDYHYDDSYKSILAFKEKKTVLWYAPCVNDVNVTYEIKDSNQFHYQLPSLIENNYVSLISAHSASIINNETMIRFDDYEYDQEANKATVYTSRTTFFNDLVTNRVSDYKINDTVSLRNIYESGKFLNPLTESKFSNHIGINAIVFVGDEMVFTLRGATGTVSKNMLTSTVAVGVKEKDFVNEYSYEENISRRIVIEKLNELLNSDKKEEEDSSTKQPVDLNALLNDGTMKVYCMGFGRHIYMGGKPQFYYAVTFQKGSVIFSTKRKSLQNVVDYNTGQILVKSFGLSKKDGYVLRLETTDGKIIKREAERSFFVNCWHIISQKRIPGIPDWFYENVKVVEDETTDEKAGAE